MMESNQDFMDIHTQGKISRTSSVLPHCCLLHMGVHHLKGSISPPTIPRRKEDIALQRADTLLLGTLLHLWCWMRGIPLFNPWGGASGSHSLPSRAWEKATQRKAANGMLLAALLSSPFLRRCVPSAAMRLCSSLLAAKCPWHIVSPVGFQGSLHMARCNTSLKLLSSLENCQ